jgi:hypothetical protein
MAMLVITGWYPWQLGGSPASYAWRNAGPLEIPILVRGHSKGDDILPDDIWLVLLGTTMSFSHELWWCPLHYMFPYNNPMVLRNASNQSSFGQHRHPPSGWLMLGRCLDLEFSNSVEIQLVIKPLVNGWFEYVLIYVFMGSSFWTTNSSQR